LNHYSKDSSGSLTWLDKRCSKHDWTFWAFYYIL